jgi:hypothetical protein
VERNHYAEFIAPQLLKIKLKYFQDSHVIFHEREIRKAERNFSFLTKESIRTEFFADLSDFMFQAQFTVIASVIRKDHLQSKYLEPGNPYILGTDLCVQRLLSFLNRHNESLPTTVAFEARGKKEDADLELAFFRLMQEQEYAGRFQIKILPKISNCCGLQLADLIARPIGRYVLDPNQPNKAYNIICEKLDSYNGGVDGYGLKVFP